MPPIAIGVGAAVAATGAIAYGAAQQAKAQKSAQEFAEQQAAESRVEQQRLEEKYSLTPGQLSAEDDLLKQYTKRSGMTGEDLIRAEGESTAKLSDTIQSRLGKSGRDLFLEEGGEAGRQYASRVEQPGASDTFAPELELVRQMVNAEANRRGVFGGQPKGGIRFEQLGRAGVDLAIKSARESLAQKSALASAYINLGQNARAEAGTVGERALTTSERARAELSSFLSGKSQTSAQVATQAAGIADQGVGRSYNTITDIYGQQAGQGAAYQSAGLGALGDLAGLSMTGGLSSAKATTTPTQIKTPEFLPGESIGLRSGAVGNQFLEDEYANIRRRRGY